MKKIIALVMVALLAIGVLCGCAAMRKCDACGAKGAGNKYEGKHLCDNCYSIVEAAENLGNFDLGSLS